MKDKKYKKNKRHKIPLWFIIINLGASILFGGLVYLALDKEGDYISIKNARFVLIDELDSILVSDSLDLNNYIEHFELRKADGDLLKSLYNQNKKINTTELLHIISILSTNHGDNLNYPLILNSNKMIPLYWAFLSGVLVIIITSSIYLAYIRQDVLKIINDPVSHITDDILKKSVSDGFSDILTQLAGGHNSIVSGLYHRYPVNYSEFFLQSIESYRGQSGITIWINNFPLWQYSELAKKLMNNARKSLYSTTYYNYDDFIAYLNEEATGVESWLTECREKYHEKKAKTDFLIKRTQIVKRCDIYDWFQPFIDYKSGNNGLQKYISLYASENTCDDYKIYLIDDKHPIYFGEYMIFDEEIMIQYDPTFFVMKVFTGKIVEKHCEPFLASNSYPHIINSLQEFLSLNNDLYEDFKDQISNKPPIAENRITTILDLLLIRSEKIKLDIELKRILKNRGDVQYFERLLNDYYQKLNELHDSDTTLVPRVDLLEMKSFINAFRVSMSTNSAWMVNLKKFSNKIDQAIVDIDSIYAMMNQLQKHNESGQVQDIIETLKNKREAHIIDIKNQIEEIKLQIGLS